MNQINRNNTFRGLGAAVSVCALLGGAVPAVQGVEGIISPPAPPATQDLLDSLLNLGPFQIRPHLLGSVVYDDNIRISRDDKQDDIILTFAPGVLIGTGGYRSGSGNYLSLDYTPGFFLYTQHDENSAVDHMVNLAGQYTFTRLTLGLSHSYQVSSGGLVEAGDRIDRRIHTTTLTSRYQYSTKTGFEVNFRQTISEFDGLDVQGYNEWVNQDWINYSLTERINIGAGATFGIRDVQGSPNETFEQGLLRAGYKVTTKIDVTASVGGEFRQFQGGESSGPSLVFSLGGVFRPRETTEIGLEAFRQDQASVVSLSQNYTATGLRATARQRFLQRYSVGVGAGYQHASYRGVEEGVSTDRADDYFYVGPEFAYRISDRWDAGLFYHYRQNISNDSAFDFINNQVGIRSGFRF